MIDPVTVLVPNAAREALLRHQYTSLVATTPARQQSTEPTPNKPATDLMALFTENATTVRDTADPREFGFDPARAWTGLSRTEDPLASLGLSIRSAPNDSTARVRLRRLFESRGRNDRIAGKVGPVDNPFSKWVTAPQRNFPRAQAVLRDAALGGITRSGASAFSGKPPGSRGTNFQPLRAGVLEDVDDLVKVGPAASRQQQFVDSGGNRSFEHELREPLGMFEFAKRVLIALLSTPWVYLGLTVLIIGRLITAGLRTVR